MQSLVIMDRQTPANIVQGIHIQFRHQHAAVATETVNHLPPGIDQHTVTMTLPGGAVPTALVHAKHIATVFHRTGTQ